MNEEKLTSEEIRIKYGPPVKRDSDYINNGPLTVYLPTSIKASLLIGNPDSSNAISTGWSDPWMIMDEELLEYCAIAASLRTPRGLNYLIHNLARNPTIRTLVLRSGAEQDKSADGRRSRKPLLDFFQNGIDENGTVIGSEFTLAGQLIKDGAISVLESIRQNVRVVDYSDLPKSDFLPALKGLPNLGPYRDSVLLPELEGAKVNTFPSERVGMVITGRDGYEVMMSIWSHIKRFGSDVLLETDAQVRIRELEFLRVSITGEEPFAHPPKWLADINPSITYEDLVEYHQTYGKPDRFLRPVSANFETDATAFAHITKFVRPPGEKYHYAELAYRFPRQVEIDLAVDRIFNLGGLSEAVSFLRSISKKADENEVNAILASDLKDDHKLKLLIEIFIPPIDQIAEVVKRLQTIPDDADKIISLWNPNTYGQTFSGRPCWILADFRPRHGQLDMVTHYRTHDAWGGALKNFFTNSATLDEVAAQTTFKRGGYFYTGSSAHIYQGSMPDVEELLSKQKFSGRFNPDDRDPRGNVVVTVDRGMIYLTQTHPQTGEEIRQIKGKSVKSMVQRMIEQEWFSQPGHALDIGTQIGSAVAALAAGTEFTQDRLEALHHNLRSLQA